MGISLWPSASRSEKGCGKRQWLGFLKLAYQGCGGEDALYPLLDGERPRGEVV